MITKNKPFLIKNFNINIAFIVMWAGFIKMSEFT